MTDTIVNFHDFSAKKKILRKDFYGLEYFSFLLNFIGFIWCLSKPRAVKIVRCFGTPWVALDVFLCMFNALKFGFL